MVLNRWAIVAFSAMICALIGGCSELVFNGPSPAQIKDDLGVVSLHYQLYQTTNGKSPTSWEQLESACVEDGSRTAIRTVRNAGYTLKWGVKSPGLGDADEVFGEKPGGGPVLMGDGRTEWARP